MKVLDFGIAKLVEPEAATNITKTGTIMGTPQYMSPEQCTGRGVDHRTDVYSLGVIMFQIFCGRLPFEDGSVAEIMSAHLTKAPPRPGEFAAISPGMESLLLSCLDKNPANRPASAAELGLRLKDAAVVGGVVTAMQAPFRRTDEASAATKKGFATGLPTLLAGSEETKGEVPKKTHTIGVGFGGGCIGGARALAGAAWWKGAGGCPDASACAKRGDASPRATNHSRAAAGQG